MTGLIWFVQLVHYPLFHYAARSDFHEFARQHQRRTTWIVLPLMTLELTTAIAIAVTTSGADVAERAYFGLACLILIWLSTAFLQVPLHDRLARGFDAATARALTRGNWLRTGLWTTRSMIAMELLAR